MQQNREINSLNQSEVDFIIPKYDQDIPLGIDPFLLYKSRHQPFKVLHEKLLSVFNEGIRILARGDEQKARTIFDFPEVQEIGLGYAKRTKKGAGLGTILNNLLVDTLSESPELIQRGVKHIEEMQLVSLGIGADRISDIAANILKEYLIEYTQEQSRLWNLSVQANVPVHHILDVKTLAWYDGYFDLPISRDGDATLFVPRRVVRLLPWINFDDYLKSEFALFLRAKSSKDKVRKKRSQQLRKQKAVEITRKEIERIDHYIKKKEAKSADALPSQFGYEHSKQRVAMEAYANDLKKMPVGQETARDYQRKILEILNSLFEPDLIDGKLEEPTIHGSERRDIIFVNDSDKSFFEYLRNSHKNFLLMFEVKNVSELSPDHFNQTATYLGDKLGYCGFIVTRNQPSKSDNVKGIAVYNNLKRVIIVLSDEDMIEMLLMKGRNSDPMRHLQKRYRQFMVSAQ